MALALSGTTRFLASLRNDSGGWDYGLGPGGNYLSIFKMEHHLLLWASAKGKRNLSLVNLFVNAMRMGYEIEYYSEKVQEEIAKLPKTLVARYPDLPSE